MTKSNPENCKNCSPKSADDCTTSVHNTTQNSSDYLPSHLQTNTIAQMSVGGEGDRFLGTTTQNNKMQFMKILFEHCSRLWVLGHPIFTDD